MRAKEQGYALLLSELAEPVDSYQPLSIDNAVVAIVVRSSLFKPCSVTGSILELYPSPVTGGLAKAFERLQPLNSTTFAPAVVYGMS